MQLKDTMKWLGKHFFLSRLLKQEVEMGLTEGVQGKKAHSI